MRSLSKELIAEHERLRAAFPFSGQPFEEAALAVFRFQAQANEVYGRWLSYLHRDWREVGSADQIPFLPIEFFKTQRVTSRPDLTPIHTFLSSRTTGQMPSRHEVVDFYLYEKAARMGFEGMFGGLEQFHFMSLLPSYSQTGESSLVHMAHGFSLAAGQSGAKKIEPTVESLKAALEYCLALGKRPVLFGVTHALLDLVETGGLNLPFLLFETGGMKGRGPELTRPELQARLRRAFPAADIRSEYGMTELFSQGYTTENGGEHFHFPSWMRGYLRDPTDPLSPSVTRQRGALNIIDIANLDSCAFIATSDQAEIDSGKVNILGRLDHAEIRGCNLLMF